MNLDDSEGAMAFEDTFLMDLDDSDGDGGADLHIDFKDETVSESDISGTEVDTRTAALGHIESLVLSFLAQLSSANTNRCKVQQETVAKVVKPKKIELQLADRRKPAPDGSCGVRSIIYPKKSRGASAKSIAQLFRVLDLSHESLVYDAPVTKRDIYYKDVPLFKTQVVVDRLVDDLAATFNLERSDLNIRATSKGLVCGGGLVIHLVGGESIHVNDSEGALIPVGEDISHFEVDEDVSWVLVVEKDAIFQTLCRLRLTNHPALRRGIIITGKGYPDIATRQLVKSLGDNLPSTAPILALVDGDAYGLDILSVYKHGSFAMRHESERLAAGRIEWVGIWASELTSLGVDRDAMIPITPYDEKKTFSMLRRPESVMPAKWRKELMHMLHTRRKAEIEIICSTRPVPSSFSTTRQIFAHKQERNKIHPEDQDDQIMDSSTGSDLYDGSSLPPLLRYLLRKISDFVGSNT